MKQRRITTVLAVLALLCAGFPWLVALFAPDPAEARRAFAIASMVTGLALIWGVAGGAMMLRFRDRVRARVQALPFPPPVVFVAFATLLACLEEAVTVSMTNLAPLFGSRPDQAHITASTNYLDVIALHSVVVFVPFFIALAVILRRHAFSPFAVFLAFGLVGTLSEAIFAGSPGPLVVAPMWIFVYGLMVWLPAFSLPQRPNASRPGTLAHLVLPFAILALALPMIVPLVWLITGVLDHPAIHFP